MPVTVRIGDATMHTDAVVAEMETTLFTTFMVPPRFCAKCQKWRILKFSLYLETKIEEEQRGVKQARRRRKR